MVDLPWEPCTHGSLVAEIHLRLRGTSVSGETSLVATALRHKGQQREVNLGDSWETIGERTETQPWDMTEHLETEEDMAAYLEAALEEGDAALVTTALGGIASAKGMTLNAKEAGLGRESPYQALSPGGNHDFATVLKAVRALRLRLRATPSHA